MHRELTRVVARALVRAHQLQSDLVTRMCHGDLLDAPRVLEKLEEISEDLVTLQAFLSEDPPALRP